MFGSVRNFRPTRGNTIRNVAHNKSVNHFSLMDVTTPRHNFQYKRHFHNTSVLRDNKAFSDILQEVWEESKEEFDKVQDTPQKHGSVGSSMQREMNFRGSKNKPQLSDEDMERFFNNGKKLNPEAFVEYIQKGMENPAELSWLLHNGFRGTEEEEAEEDNEFWEAARKQRVGEPERDFVDSTTSLKGVRTSHMVSDYMPEMRKYFRCPSIEWEDVEKLYLQDEHYRDAIIVDLREKMQVASTGPLPSSINLPMSLIQDGGLLLQPPAFAQAFGVAKPPFNTDVILVSVDPNAAELAAIAFGLSGWFRLYNYRAGMNDFAANLVKRIEETQNKMKDPENHEDHLNSIATAEVRKMEDMFGFREVEQMKLRAAYHLVSVYESGDKETLKKLLTAGEKSPLAGVELPESIIEKGIAEAKELIAKYEQ